MVENEEFIRREPSNFFGIKTAAKDEYDREYDKGRVKKIRKRQAVERPDFQRAYDIKQGGK